MTDLMNGHQPTNPMTPPAAFVNGKRPQQSLQTPQMTEPDKEMRRHPKQAHLNTLIHAKIVTHLVHVDEVPDTLFALSQMQDLPEVRFAAIFDDGLIALGCPAGLPEALATIAEPAFPTAPPRHKTSTGLQRIEQVSRRLETLVNTMEPEEVILSDQLGRSILERLTSLETQLAQPREQLADPAVVALKGQIDALQDKITAFADPAPALSVLAAKISDVAERPAPMTDFSEHHDQLSALMTTAAERIDAGLTDMKAQAEQTLSAVAAHEAGDSGQALTQLADQLARLERTVQGIATPSTAHNAEVETTLKALAKSVQSSLSTQTGTEQVTEKIEQLGTAQRTAFTRIEAAMTKAVSGLEPALDHLNARAEDTENRLSDWHKDLKSLSVHTRSLADTTEQLPSVFATLQNDVTTLANKPEPVLDLSAQQQGFEQFSVTLTSALKDIEGFTLEAREKTTHAAAQSDETIATLQTLPTLISATLRHEVDLKPIEQGLANLQTDLPAIAVSLAAVTEQITPMHASQTLEFEGVQTSLKSILQHLDSLDGDVSRLNAKDTDLDPLKEMLGTVQQQLGQAGHDTDSHFDTLGNTLNSLAQHLGAAPRAATQVVPSSALVPETSLNTLRMEFADLIAKRMQENDNSITAHAQQA